MLLLDQFASTMNVKTIGSGRDASDGGRGSSGSSLSGVMGAVGLVGVINSGNVVWQVTNARRHMVGFYGWFGVWHLGLRLKGVTLLGLGCK